MEWQLIELNSQKYIENSKRDSNRKRREIFEFIDSTVAPFILMG